MRSSGGSSASRSPSSRRSSGSSPLVQRVRLFLHVPGAVRDPDEPEAVPLVEPARAVVLLEDPELEALGPLNLRVVEQRRPDPATLAPGLDVQVADRRALEPE